MSSTATVSGWAVKPWRGGLYNETIRRTRTEAIAAFIDQFGDQAGTWRLASKRDIHRAVRVTVAIQGEES